MLAASTTHMIHIPPALDLLRSLCLFPKPMEARPRHAVQGADAARPSARTLLTPPSVHAALSCNAVER
eukprot:12191869-Alexandrium_andersonii.AAC.1